MDPIVHAQGALLFSDFNFHAKTQYQWEEEALAVSTKSMETSMKPITAPQSMGSHVSSLL
jgi:hypothetical protein